jgi:hypothetical protein
VGEDTLFLAGRLEPVRPGLAQFRVREVRLKGINVPTRLIPGLVRQLRAAAASSGTPETERPAGTAVDSGAAPASTIADDGLPVALPGTVSDVRVVNGKLTLYRATVAASPSKSKR